MSFSDYTHISTYHETTNYLKQKLPTHLKEIKYGIVCGSGLGGLVNCFDQDTVEFEYKVLLLYP